MSVLPPLSDALQSIIKDAAHQAGLGDIAQPLCSLATSAAFLAPSEPSTSAGQHQIGGLPTVNEAFHWPEHLSFVAQIDLADLPTEFGLTLPTQGTLLFFADAEKQENGPCMGRGRAGAVFWQPNGGHQKAEPPAELAKRSHDGVFAPLNYASFPGLSICPLDSQLLDLVVIDESWWPMHAQLSHDLKAIAAPAPARRRGRKPPVGDRDWLQMGGHVQYFRDGTDVQFMMGAILEKHGFAREFSLGADTVRKQIQMYHKTLPKWCSMLQAQIDLFERQQATFQEDAEELVLLLTVPSLPQLGAVWGDDLYVSYVIDRRDLKRQRFEEAWVLFHP